MELQRGEELMAISGVPCTARAQQPLLDQVRGASRFAC